MTKFSRTKKEKKVQEPVERNTPAIGELLFESALKKPLSDYVNKELSESVVRVDKIVKDLEAKLHVASIREIQDLKKYVEKIDDDLAEGLPLFDKHQKTYVEDKIKSIKESLDSLEGKVSKQITEATSTLVSRGDFDNALAKMKFVTPKEFKDNLKSIGEFHKTYSLGQKGQVKRLNDVDKMLKKMADDIKKAGEVFEFGYSLGVTQNGSFVGNVQFLNFVNNEVVAGSGTSFTLANVPIVGSVQLYGEGQRLTPGNVDYTISGKNITIKSDVGQTYSAGTILADYRT